MQLTKYCYMMNSKEGEKMFTLLINNNLSALLVQKSLMQIYIFFD